MSDTGTRPQIDLLNLIDWSAGDKEPSRFVTNTIIQTGDSEIILLLYEVLIPSMERSGVLAGSVGSLFAEQNPYHAPRTEVGNWHRFVTSSPQQETMPNMSMDLRRYYTTDTFSDTSMTDNAISIGQMYRLTWNDVATPLPSILTEVALMLALPVARRLASFLDELAGRHSMPVARTVVSKHAFLSDGRTRVFVRQYISRSPEEVVEYADASSDEIDSWINKLPTREREYFDDDISMDIHWA